MLSQCVTERDHYLGKITTEASMLESVLSERKSTNPEYPSHCSLPSHSEGPGEAVGNAAGMRDGC